ncbi:MAG: hypothetical protein JNL34_00435, partial [Anaerolineae bacterium]|nr:hypothetical protein [Anaerolineae bacterium]
RKQSIEAPDSLIPEEQPAPVPPDIPLSDAVGPASETQAPPEAAPPVQPPPPPPQQVATAYPPRKRRRAWPYNLVTCFTLLLACGACAFIAAIWVNPYSALNPFPPLTPLPVVVSMTPTITLTPEPTATLTPEPTLTPTITPTPEPTEPPTVTPIPVAAIGENSFAPIESGGRQVVFIANPEARGACAWQSVAGTLTDVNGAPLNDYRIRVLGDGIDATATTGSAPGYGPGGFEVQLGNEAREGQVAVQVLDPAGATVSDVVSVPISARCDWNISIIRFQQLAAP